MLKIRAKQLSTLDDYVHRRFAGELRATLAASHLHIFQAFPMPVQEQIVMNILGRAERWGITWQSAHLAFAEMMLSIAPNFDDLPEVRTMLRFEWITANRAVLSMDRRLIANGWRAAGLPAHDLPLFTPPEVLDAPLLDQTAAALPVALGDRIGGADPQVVAESALSMATSLGLDAIPDAGLVVTAWRLFYGSGFRDRDAFPWVAETFGYQLPPAQIVSQLKLRIRADHGRFV